MDIASWLLWAPVLLVQNFAFTFVSRARNSGSLKRHMIASIFSNGVWFVSQAIIFSVFFQAMTGKLGAFLAVTAGLYYTTFTLAGSLAAHYWALRTEKGKSAVGASMKYAQVPVEEWEEVKRLVLWEKRDSARLCPNEPLSSPSRLRPITAR